MQKDLKGKRITFWPINIDEQAPISRGRKIPRDAAVRSPKVEEIVEAAKALGLNPEVEEASYPRSWWSDTKRIVVDKRWSKRETLKRISMEIRSMRVRRRKGKHT